MRQGMSQVGKAPKPQGKTHQKLLPQKNSRSLHYAHNSYLSHPSCLVIPSVMMKNKRTRKICLLPSDQETVGAPYLA